MTDLKQPCPCFSGSDYDHCCKPFHEGALPDHPLQLMRARYAAYVLNLPDYIIHTTHPASPQYSINKFSWKRSIAQFAHHSSFHGLDILDIKTSDTLATVTFTAHLSQGKRDATFTEKSYFEKFKNRWCYRGGQLAEGHAPNLITTTQLRLLPLAYYGDSILKKKAEPVAEITSDIKKLVEEMVETMDACDGAGLAAPQVHHSIRLFMIRTPVERKDNHVGTGELHVFINPELSSPSTDTWTASEGCLSIPTIRAAVERPKTITVTYTTLDGTQITRQVSGWEGRVIMHEYDHIEGVLFIDRLHPKERSKFDSALANLEQRLHDGMAL